MNRPAMDLKSGCILWPCTDGPIATYPKLPRDLDVDVAIVGGGMAGGICRTLPREGGVAAALVDRRDICHGSTTASTGLLQFEIDQPLIQSARLLGKDHPFAHITAGGARKLSEDQMMHGQPPVSMLEFLTRSEFWFQS